MPGMDSPEVALLIKPNLTPRLQIEQQRGAVSIELVQFIVADFNSITVLGMFQSVLKDRFSSDASGKVLLHVFLQGIGDPMTCTSEFPAVPPSQQA